jgi:hypothetical protein
VSFLEGWSAHPGAWPPDRLPAIGQLLRRLHEATGSFRVPRDTVWRPWFGRRLGVATVIGHCDTGPWNLLARADGGVALIDWENARSPCSTLPIKLVRQASLRERTTGTRSGRSPGAPAAPRRCSPTAEPSTPRCTDPRSKLGVKGGQEEPGTAPDVGLGRA